MSYCRFSDRSCDLYCYESDCGHETHVATYRYRKWKELYHFLTDRRVKCIGRIFRYPRWGYLFWMPHWITHVRIGLPEDGKHFTDETITDFHMRVKWLKQVGYQVPEWVLEYILFEATINHDLHLPR